MSKPFFLADILRSSISFSWRRLMFSIVGSVLLRPEWSLLKFKLDPSVLFFSTFYQMVILVGETLSLSFTWDTLAVQCLWMKFTQLLCWERITMGAIWSELVRVAICLLIIVDEYHLVQTLMNILWKQFTGRPKFYHY